MKKVTLKSRRFLLASQIMLLTAFACSGQGKTMPSKALKFKKTQITSEFISEGVSVGDVNKDGKIDILSGAYWFEAPNWTKHEIDTPQTFNYKKGYSNSFLNYCLDVNLDGWVDFIRIDHPGEAAFWYENPKNKPGHWVKHEICSSLGTENPLLVDIDGDKRPDLIGNDAKTKEIIWLRAPRKKGETKWERFVISTDEKLATHRYTHGLGLADMNKDGRKDVLIKEGWWEAPKEGPTHPNWKFHPANFGQECAQMYVMDLNNDGLDDIITSSAHEYGIWWHEQKKDAKGQSSWIQHEIYKGFSQTHSLQLIDMNGDGHLDLVTGKRYFAHNGNDPGEYEPAVIYWFEYVPGKNPQWIPHQIDDDSGIGLSFVVADITGDKRLDIVVSNKKGVHFLQQTK